MTGDELKALRKSRRLQLNELAYMLGISRMTLYRHEQSDELPKLVEYAVCYLLGHMIITFVEVDHTRKRRGNVNNLRDPYENVVIGNAEFEDTAPTEARGAGRRILPKPTDGKVITPIGATATPKG